MLVLNPADILLGLTGCFVLLAFFILKSIQNGPYVLLNPCLLGIFLSNKSTGDYFGQISVTRG